MIERIIIGIIITLFLVSCSNDLEIMDVAKVGTYQYQIESVVGKGEKSLIFRDAMFVDYPEKGLQVNYNRFTRKAIAIFFFNKDKHHYHFKTYNGEIIKGINWDSDRKDIVEIFGEPYFEHAGERSQRLEYEGFDFRFEYSALCRISFFPKEHMIDKSERN